MANSCPWRWIRRSVVFAGLLVLASGGCLAEVVRVPLDQSAAAALQDGRLLFLECRPPRGEAARAYFERYLASPAEWISYRNRKAVAVRYERLKPEIQRQVLLLVFPRDYVDEQGWWHTALYSGKRWQETLWGICEWTTGYGLNYQKILAAQKDLTGPVLQQGQKVLIPRELLLPVMQAPTSATADPPVPAEPVPPAPATVAAPNQRPYVPGKAPLPDLASEAAASEAAAPGDAQAAASSAESESQAGLNGDERPPDLDAVARELVYGQDNKGAYAMYRLKPGEALYTAVVVRFTDYRDNADVSQACKTIQERSGVDDVRNMPAGQKVLIPLDMLADRFRPQGSEQREEYEKGIQEARRLRQEKVLSKDLDGVVVVLDPGHGGRDQGGSNSRYGLYEDELNYDVVCRVKKILETQTRAKVYITMIDPSQGYRSTDQRKFAHDTDEKLLTNPNYENKDAKISANLRWYLANAYFREELKKGTDPRKVVFTSFHTDALYNATLRGAMTYIPGASYRRANEMPEGAIYANYAECRQEREVSSTASERRRDEALSRNFAEDLMTALGRKNIRRHLEGDWIRTQIRQKGGVVYLPAVLRNTKIPTKVLIEMANITNPTDCQRLADPEWRQAFAEAYVEALKTYFGS